MIFIDDPTPTPEQHRRHVAAWLRLWRTMERLGLNGRKGAALLAALAVAMDEQQRLERVGARALAEHRRRRHR
jgi:hypothetical protein